MDDHSQCGLHPGYILGAGPDSVVNMLEKRPVEAVRVNAIDGYGFTVVTSRG